MKKNRYLYKDMNEHLNQKLDKSKIEPNINPQNVEAELKFEPHHADENRQIVVKDKFVEFQTDYEKTQESKETH